MYLWGKFYYIKKEGIIMSLSDIFNASKIKQENEQLKQLMTPEMQSSIALQNRISELQKQESNITNLINIKNSELQALNRQIQDKQIGRASCRERV